MLPEIGVGAMNETAAAFIGGMALGFYLCLWLMNLFGAIK